ncbi:hypothetical protein BDV3_002114 [Batrachochytrium dendrobatidis]|uniref:Non-haem dioxygenase N-terminal domain-containing protein n=1 Tax=Batrachochytrium dendrobatidis (strain JEL423) TaxID=403673 RepID=A0A177WU73_BATDL|nr:hypothetical protein O5D80_007194 [Batrachochytrium dendrobatidis]KAK5664775.1 hypothetical protein QVD99_008320 [Batrachochytrium dendrobatidis]OAJ43649.1 hypothetical protein BDEG_26991 [Batrachochytrium dendrobatidis JEL423]
MTAPAVVLLDYNDIKDSSKNLSAAIAEAFGSSPGCLGACFVKNVPGFAAMRQRLLRLASVFAALPEEQLQAVTHTKSSYLFGWSHGKEIMNGKPDTAKGSYYNNPIRDVPPMSTNSDYLAKFPEYGYPNVWPEKLPELREAFMELGQLIVEVGKLVSIHCDKFLVEKYPDLPAHFMHEAIDKSDTIKARLLHYFPIDAKSAAPTPDGGNLDSWCGLHIDHSMLTGLTSAMYFDESNGEFKEADKSNPEVAEALGPAGLYIQGRGGEFVQVKIPADCLAFQIGEAAQVGSRGLLVATPHLVRGAAYPDLARNTFAVFMQPNVDYKLTPEKTFNDFTKDVMVRHYDGKI